jgi:hypothetical protein
MYVCMYVCMYGSVPFRFVTALICRRNVDVHVNVNVTVDQKYNHVKERQEEKGNLYIFMNSRFVGLSKILCLDETKYCFSSIGYV